MVVDLLCLCVQLGARWWFVVVAAIGAGYNGSDNWRSDHRTFLTDYALPLSSNVQQLPVTVGMEFVGGIFAEE